MTKTLQHTGVKNLILCEESIRELLGDAKLQEFKYAADKLNSLLKLIENSGIFIHIRATESNITYELKDSCGQIIPESKCSHTESWKPFVILGHAISRAIYLLNKKLKQSAQLLH
jgi:hypothetical protein